MTNSALSLLDVLSDVLTRKHDLDPLVAKLLAKSIISGAQALGYGGKEYYLPVRMPEDRDERNAMIRADFNGRNLRDVCRRYGVSKTTVYKACRLPQHSNPPPPHNDPPNSAQGL